MPPKTKKNSNNNKIENFGIELDFTNATEKVVGFEHGITECDLESVKNSVESARQVVEGAKKDGKLGFCKLPYTKEDDLDEIIKTAEEISENFSDFVVLGIGGSALGNIAIQNALNHPFYNQLHNETLPRLYVLDNVDPELISGLMDIVPLEKTFFNVITKSGSTAETVSQFLIFRKLLMDNIGKSAYKRQVIITTDPEKGFLRKIADDEKLKSLPIPSDVGGRFSVLTPVGLLSAAVCGINIKELVLGARKMDEFLTQCGDVYSNPAAMYSAIHYIMDVIKKKPMAVMIPYAQSLRDFADWYRQLLAESLGKKFDRAGNIVHTGTTPIKALGATDQHSQIQLYAEGPFDKILTFLGVKKFQQDVKIPVAYKEYPEISYLGGQTMSKLIQSEQVSTETALAKAGRPSVTITIDEVNPRTIGALIYLFEYHIALSGEMYDINAFDQPGVEEGKNLTYAMMGREGFEHKRTDVENAIASKTGNTMIKWSLD